MEEKQTHFSGRTEVHVIRMGIKDNIVQLGAIVSETNQPEDSKSSPQGGPGLVGLHVSDDTHGDVLLSKANKQKEKLPGVLEQKFSALIKFR